MMQTSTDIDLGSFTYEQFAAAKALFEALFVPVYYIPTEHANEKDERGREAIFWDKEREVMILHPNNVKIVDSLLRQQGMRLQIVDKEWHQEQARMRLFKPIQLEMYRE
jgi:hypothetical protein